MFATNDHWSFSTITLWKKLHPTIFWYNAMIKYGFVPTSCSLDDILMVQSSSISEPRSDHIRIDWLNFWVSLHMPVESIWVENSRKIIEMLLGIFISIPSWNQRVTNTVLLAIFDFQRLIEEALETIDSDFSLTHLLKKTWFLRIRCGDKNVVLGIGK